MIVSSSEPESVTTNLWKLAQLRWYPGFLRIHIIISFPKNCLACRFPGMLGMFWTFGFFGGTKAVILQRGGTWRWEERSRATDAGKGKIQENFPPTNKKHETLLFLKKVDFNPWKFCFLLENSQGKVSYVSYSTWNHLRFWSSFLRLYMKSMSNVYFASRYFAQKSRLNI